MVTAKLLTPCIIVLCAAASTTAASENNDGSKAPAGLNLPALREWEALDEEGRTSQLRERLVGDLARNRAELAVYLQTLADVRAAQAPSTALVLDAVGLIADKSAVPVLANIAISSPNYDLRRRAMKLLATQGDASLIPKLLPTIDTTDKDKKVIRDHHQTLDVTIPTIVALSQSFDGHKLLIDSLQEMLPKASEAFKVRAIQVLRHVETADAETLLLGLVQDSSKLIRFDAANALGYSGQSRAPQVLADILRSAEKVNECKAVIIALGRYKHLASLDVLIPLLDNKDVHKDAVYAVHNITGRQFQTSAEANAWLKTERDVAQKQFDELAAVVKSPNIDHAAVAIERLSEQVLLRGKVVDLLIPLLNHGNHRIRGACCFTLGKTGELRAYGYIIEKLRDPSPEVSYTAWRAIKQATGRDFPRDFGTWRAWLDKRN